MFKWIFKKEVKPHKDAWGVVILVLIFILLRLPSLIEPYWYGDEGIYQVIGKALNSGRVLYQGIWDNKPPLLYYIYAFFNGEQFFVRATSLAVGAFSVIAFYFLGKKLFKKKRTVQIATLIYVFLFATPLLEGNIANAENFMHLPIIVSALLIFKFINNKKLTTLFLAGFVLSIAFMTKIVAVFEFLAFIIFIFLANNPEFSFKKITSYMSVKKIKPEIIFFTGFISLLILFSIYFLIIGAFPDFLSGVLAENIDYVGAENSLVFPMGILFLKVIILIFVTALLIIKRNKFSSATLFIFLWLIFSLFSTFFSHRPYTHYILMTALPFSYLVGSIIDSKKDRILKIAIAIIVTVVICLNFSIYKNISGYYKNYLDFVFFNKPVDSYQSFFDSNTPRDYEIARLIKMLSDGSEYDVFLWSNSGQIYALSDTLPPGKYIVAYHITYYNNAVEYMVEQVEKTKPSYIIKTSDSPEVKEFLPSYVLKYKIKDANIYERQN